MAKVRRRFRLSELEAVGWGFWLICFFVFLAPCIWLMTLVVYDNTTFWAHGMFGLLTAAFIAGIVSWLANSALQAKTARRKKALQQNKRKDRA
jgi:uncharacterized membrane protein YvlD (DUF360 family)